MVSILHPGFSHPPTPSSLPRVQAGAHKMKKSKDRVTFNQEEAIHLYELALEHFVDGCPQCNKVKEKLIKCIGKYNAGWVRECVDEFSYCETIMKERKEVKK